MHHALRLEEILLNIFGQCYSPGPTNRQRTPRGTADLVALARTCRMFKEPALDVLWTELVNLSPLARCLPEASHRIYPGYTVGRSRAPSEIILSDGVSSGIHLAGH